MLSPSSQRPPPVNGCIDEYPPDIRLRRCFVAEQKPPAAVGALKSRLQEVLRCCFIPTAEHQRKPQQVRGAITRELLERFACVHHPSCLSASAHVTCTTEHRRTLQVI